MWMVILVNIFFLHYSVTDTFLSAFGEMPNLVSMQVMRWVPLVPSLFRGQGGWEGFENAAWEPTANRVEPVSTSGCWSPVLSALPTCLSPWSSPVPSTQEAQSPPSTLPGVLGSFLRKSTMDIRNLIDSQNWLHLTHWVPCWNFSSSLYTF